VWLSIAADRKVEQDALYIHSANPNGTPFPYPFPSADWNVPVPEFLVEFVHEETQQLGYFQYEAQPQYVVRQRPS